MKQPCLIQQKPLSRIVNSLYTEPYETFRMKHMSLKDRALAYHGAFPAGLLKIALAKSMATPEDLSLAYTPGVAEPCKEIAENPETAYLYTMKSNLVAVISNGTAVLGLGDIGALASKPVMQGKAGLFKVFAGVDSFDIEIDEKDPKKLIEIIKAISPTFGGINLEDIKAPECFEIEETLSEILDIPVFHDDQHGTAIVVSAALINACKVQGRALSDLVIVVSGAGAGAMACMDLLMHMGLKPEQFYVFDSKGLIHKGRSDLSERKAIFAKPEELTLEQALAQANTFLGLSKANLVSDAMVSQMQDKPIIFALANPNPEILPTAITRTDAVVATGRSDFPNQVNNAVCFPHLFRGALDVGAKKITTKMKIAAAQALAELAHEPVPQDVLDIYQQKELSFGAHYILPKPFDRRLYYRLAKVIAKTAMEEGIARVQITDWDAYDRQLTERLQA